MNSKRNSLSLLSEVNGKAPLVAPHSFEGDDEKWDLGWLAAVFRRRAILIAGVTLGTIAAAGGALFLLADMSPSKFGGEFQLLVEPVTVEQQQAQSAARAQGSQTPAVEQINIEQSRLDYETQIRILQSPRLMEPIVKEIQTRYPEMTYDLLLRNLKISRINTVSLDKKEQGTKLIAVAYQDVDAKKVQFILEALSKAYLRYSLKERQSSIRQGVAFIDSQLPALRQRVSGLQRQVQDLRQRFTIVDPEQQGQQLTTRAGNLGQQQADSQTQLAEAEAKRSTLQQQLQRSNLQSVLGEAPYYQTLQNQFQQLESQIAVESARLQPDNPAMQALLDKRRNLQNVLQIEANRLVNKAADPIAVAAARNAAIARSEAEVNQKIQQLPSVARQYADLQRELVIATESLNKFSSRREALQIDVAQQEVPWELLTPPKLNRDSSGVPVNVNAISKVRFLGLIAVLAILLGVGVGFLAEIAQDILQTTDETKRFAKLPLLGTIPLNDAENTSGTLIPNFFSKRHKAGGAATNGSDNGHSPYSSSVFIEAFRSVYKNIRLLTSPDNAIRSLTISSPEPGDGKTTIAVNLALAAAAMGQRVLLVDADLRHPQVHQQMGLTNQLGLSEILSTNVNVRTALQQSPMRDNLMVLTAGQTTVDPTEALTSGKMRLLMERFRMVFDLVIYDTPPLVGLADSSLVASQTDGLALVVRLGKTKRPALTQALEELKISSTTVLGLVANGGKNVLVPYVYHYKTNSHSQNGAAPVEIDL